MYTENDFVQELTTRFPVLPPVEIGIGDDGAVLKTDGPGRVIVVTDLLLDGVHFDLRRTSPALAGRKAMAVNLSDLAAMGCRPTAAFVSIAVPRSVPDPRTFLREVYAGMEELTTRYAFTLAGGDTNSWSHPFAINVCLTGVPFGPVPLLRSTARPGDRLMVSGPLGGSLQSGRHLTFSPRLDLSEWLSVQPGIHAVMDLSDGLSTDLPRMMTASGTGAELDAERIPIHPDVPASGAADERLASALNDGEDFELLLTVSPEAADAVCCGAAKQGFALHEVGRIRSEPGIVLQWPGGRRRPLTSQGWQHPFHDSLPGASSSSV